MWAYIVAAARGDSHKTVDKNESDREISMAYREGKVFMVSGQNDDPGPSGQNTAELSKSSTSSKNNSRSPPTCHAQIEDGIEICNDVKQV